MKKRDFLKTSVAAASTVLLPSSLFANVQGDKRLRTAHIGIGGMGAFFFALVFMFICWAAGWWLHKKKIYIKV